MFCPKCGEKMQQGSAFCGKCGAKIEAAPSAAPVADGAHGSAAAAIVSKNGKKPIIVIVAVVVVVAIVALVGMNLFGGGVKNSVNDYSWDELSRISAEIADAGDENAAIEVAKKYNLCTPDGKLDGTQVKSVKLTDGTEANVQICGFAHDNRTEGGKAGITFIFKDCIGKGMMNPGEDSSGGWKSSQMRSYLEREGMSLLPQELGKVIVPVEKLTNNVGAPSSDIMSAYTCVSSTEDSLWLFSLVELAGDYGWFNGYGHYSQKYTDEVINEALNYILDSEGTQYKLFRDMNLDPVDSNDILVKWFDGEACSWWERSAYPPGFEDSFFSVDHDGKPCHYLGSKYELGIAPGFCI